MSKSIAEKLGFKPGMSVCIVSAPAILSLGLPERMDCASPEIFLAFVSGKSAVLPVVERAMLVYKNGARFWFAYPKKSGAIRTDLSRDSGWEPLLEREFLPVSQISIDATWSALRFRRRAEIARLTRKLCPAHKARS